MIVCSLPLLVPRDAAVARQQTHVLAELAGLGPTESGRLMVAVSEVARNAVRFAEDARIDLGIEQDAMGPRLRLCVHDRGPGFDVNQALSSGGGLALAKRVAPALHVVSRPGGRTEAVVTAPMEDWPSEPELEHWSSQLRSTRAANVDETLEAQNREMAQMLTRLRENEVELEQRILEIEALNADLSKVNAQLREKNRLLDDYVSVVSHDLKAPLVGLRHVLNDMGRDVAAAVPHEDLQQSVEAATRTANGMTELVKALLAHVRQGPDNDKREALALTTVMAETLPLLRVPEGFRIETDVGDLVVATPPRLLHEVLQNLVSNALDHHDMDAGRVIVRARAEDGRAVVEVEDDGPGVPAEHAMRVFRLFHSTKRRHQEGPSGVGLATVRRIVESQGGRIRLVPEPGRGALFRFDWPLAREGRRADAGHHTGAGTTPPMQATTAVQTPKRSYIGRR